MLPVTVLFRCSDHDLAGGELHERNSLALTGQHHLPNGSSSLSGWLGMDVGEIFDQETFKSTEPFGGS